MSRDSSNTFPPGRSPLDLVGPAAAPDFHIQRGDELPRGQESTPMTTEICTIPPPAEMPTPPARRVLHLLAMHVAFDDDDDRARELLSRMPPDLVAYAAARELALEAERAVEEQARLAREAERNPSEEVLAAVRARAEQRRVEWAAWLEVHREQLLAWTPTPPAPPMVEEVVWVAAIKTGEEWDLRGAGSSPTAAHRSAMEWDLEFLLDPDQAVDTYGQLVGDPIATKLEAPVALVELRGPAELVREVAMAAVQRTDFLDDGARTVVVGRNSLMTKPAAPDLTESYRAKIAKEAERLEELLRGGYRERVRAAVQELELPIVPPIEAHAEATDVACVLLDVCGDICGHGPDWETAFRAALETEVASLDTTAIALADCWKNGPPEDPAAYLQEVLAKLTPIYVVGPQALTFIEGIVT